MRYTKKQNWEKKGLIYKPSGKIPWSLTHAQVPVASYLEEKNVIKIYFSTRDKQNRSLPAYIIVDADNPLNVLDISKKPLLELGEIGTFDDCGIMPSWSITEKGRSYLYYIGWNVRNTIPYHNSIGLAISDDGVNFSKFSTGPLWDRNHIEPHYSGTSCVIKEDNGIWKNWYLSCTEWRKIKGKAEPRYHIKYAESLDGYNWKRTGAIAINYKHDQEAGIVKASVLRKEDGYHMWFAYRNFLDYRLDRNNSYRIGYAFSNDGTIWDRQDDLVGLDVSDKGWDSVMISYPHVIEVKNKTLMFYNGNGFGASGIGYAELIN